MLTTFQTLSEPVPGTFSCHPHASFLVGITVNVDAATITICIAVIITTARNTVPLISPATISCPGSPWGDCYWVPEITQWVHG